MARMICLKVKRPCLGLFAFVCLALLLPATISQGMYFCPKIIRNDYDKIKYDPVVRDLICPVGTVASFFCGNLDNPTFRVRCHESGWSSVPPPCNLGCVGLRDDFHLGRIDYSCSRKNDGLYPVGCKAVLKDCPIGFRKPVKQCLYDGRWHGPDLQCVTNCGKILISPLYGNVTYTTTSIAGSYYSGTMASIYCAKYYDRQHKPQIIFQKKVHCNGPDWDLHYQPKCACNKIVPTQARGTIVYNFPCEGSHCRIGTIARLTNCPRGYSNPGNWRKCGMDETWEGGEQKCIRNVPPKKDTTTKSNHKEHELVIVSATTGAIIAALILLVVIVSCQRRLHYHRLRRARMRLRQDQDAFAAYITYHRNVGMTLPSYDEAVNARHHGEPPTFDEAIGSGEGDQEMVELTSEHVGTNPEMVAVGVRAPNYDDDEENEDDDNDSTLSSNMDEGRLVRVVRALFGGRSFTTRAVYCHLVANDGRSSDISARPSGSELQRSSSDTAGGGSESSGNGESSVNGDDLNDILSSVGLC